MANAESRRYRPVRTPTVLQMEAAECGAAALGIILEYHGRYVPLDVLRDECGVSRDGSNALYIKEAAKRHGLEVKAFRKPAEGLVNRRPPFIVFWEWNHFLVVEGFGAGKGLPQRPGESAAGRSASTNSSAGYSGIAFTFEPGPQFVKRGRQARARLRGLARRLSRSRGRAGLRDPGRAGAGDPQPGRGRVPARLHRRDPDRGAPSTGSSRCCWPWRRRPLMRLAAAGLQQVYLTRLEVRLTLGESLGFLRHVLRLPVAFFQRRFTGDIVTRAWQTARVARLISGELATTAVSLLTLVVYVAVMLPYDPPLTVVGVAISSLNLVALQIVEPVARRPQPGDRADPRPAAWRGVMWAIQIIESIKATGSESDLLVRWTGDQARMINAEQELGVCDALLVALPPLLASLTTILVLGLGGRQVMIGTLSIGVLVAFQSLLAGFNQPFRDLARLGSDVQELRADLDRIDDVRNRPIDPVFTPAAGRARPSRATTVAPTGRAG